MSQVSNERQGIPEHDVPQPDSADLGRIVREARKRKGWTLEETCRKAGIGRSTISKIENSQTTPSFEIVRKLTEALDIRTPQLFLQAGHRDTVGRKDVTRRGEGEKKDTPTYAHELLCTELTSKAMIPYTSRIKARDVSEFPDWIRHEGEEFLLVLKGSIALHTEHYRPMVLEEGDSCYYDSGMGHCVVSTSEEDAEILWVSLQN